MMFQFISLFVDVQNFTSQFLLFVLTEIYAVSTDKSVRKCFRETLFFQIYLSILSRMKPVYFKDREVQFFKVRGYLSGLLAITKRHILLRHLGSQFFL